MNASDKVVVSVSGSNPEAVEAISHSIGNGLMTDGFHNTVVNNMTTGEPEAADTTMLDLLRKSNPAIFDTNIQIVQQFDMSESDSLTEEVDSEESAVQDADLAD